LIPKLHPRGNSFKGLVDYVLHDVRKDSSERVAWTITANIYSDAKYAWFEMFETYKHRALLKQKAGVDSRGRDNKNPVLHYSLAWHATDNPDPEHMKAMALDSLKALGLSEHEALIAGHSDKEHHHVHVVVNTVHPWTGRTAALKFTKMEFSRWAEAYEKEYGIHCQKRIENNERRRAIARLRESEKEKIALALLSGKKPPERAPFEPINDNSPNRRRWLERKEIIGRMKALHAELDAGQKIERDETWTQQKAERDALDYATHDKLDHAREIIRKESAKKWTALYRVQGPEKADLKKKNGHPLERAVFVFKHRARLAGRGEALTMRRMIPLILSAKKLKQRLERIHWRESRAIVRDEKRITAERTEQIWQTHRAAFHTLRDRQKVERDAVKAHHREEHKKVTFGQAKDALLREADRRQGANVPKLPQAKEPSRNALKNVPVVARKPEPQKYRGDPASVLMRDQAPGAAPMAKKHEPEPKQQRGKLSLTFKEALAKDKSKMNDKARQEFMKKTMTDWKRRRAKDDFERER
jgi:hypothetical protein